MRIPKPVLLILVFVLGVVGGAAFIPDSSGFADTSGDLFIHTETVEVPPNAPATKKVFCPLESRFVLPGFEVQDPNKHSRVMFTTDRAIIDEDGKVGWHFTVVNPKRKDMSVDLVILCRRIVTTPPIPPIDPEPEPEK